MAHAGLRFCEDSEPPVGAEVDCFSDIEAPVETAVIGVGESNDEVSRCLHLSIKSSVSAEISIFE